MERDTEAALKWIVGILEKHNCTYQITGGFAAQLYGSNRELADIDFMAPLEDIEKILPETKDYISREFTRYRDDSWDIWFVQFIYKGQKIEIGAIEDAMIFDKSSGEWVHDNTDFSNSEDREIFGIMVKVVSKHSLIEYKRRLAREVDREDIRQIE